MPRPVNRRMPLSCEPCRERKIRCARNDAGTCHTCLRRGIPAAECIFLRDLRAQRVPIAGLISEDSDLASSNRELLERVQKLEHLLTEPPKLPTEGTSGSSSADMTAETQTGTTPSNQTSLPSSHTTRSLTTRSLTTRSLTTRSLPTANGSLLSKTRSGHERFEPFSSQWSSALRNSSPLPEHVDPDMDTFGADHDFPFTTNKAGLDDLLSMLPPVSYCDTLKDHYLNVFASLFHILHDPTFCREYARFRAEPEKSTPSWLALLFATLSVAAIALDEDSDILRDLGRASSASDNVTSLTSRYRAAAMQCLEADHFLWRHNLHTLQALIVLIYGINHTHGQSWALLGMAKNIAFSLGLHVDPDHFGLPLIEAEQRRRCWASLNLLYTIQNTTLGHLDPMPLPRDVRLPMDVEDEMLVPETHTPANAMQGPSKMSYILHKFRLYEICSRICNLVFSNKRRTAYDKIVELDEDITAQQESWNVQYLSDGQHGRSDYQVVHLDILFGYSYQLLLLLHRPVLMQQPGKESSICFTPAQVANSHTRCLDSARNLLAIHRRGFENPMFRHYRWYNRGLGSFHAFHAAVVIARSLGNPELDKSQITQLQRELEDSVKIFEIIAASGMSRICTKALPILRYLCGFYSSPLAQHAGLPDGPSQLPQRQAPVPPTEQWADTYQRPVETQQVDSQHLEMFLDSLHPQPWLSSSMINWTEWDTFTATNMGIGAYGPVQ